MRAAAQAQGSSPGATPLARLPSAAGPRRLVRPRARCLLPDGKVSPPAERAASSRRLGPGAAGAAGERTVDAGAATAYGLQSF